LSNNLGGGRLAKAGKQKIAKKLLHLDRALPRGEGQWKNRFWRRGGKSSKRDRAVYKKIQKDERKKERSGKGDRRRWGTGSERHSSSKRIGELGTSR